MNQKIKILYLAAALIHLLLIVINQFTGILIISKLSLMPLLMLLVFNLSKTTANSNFTILLLLSLFFSFLGDLLLSNLFDREQTFIFGLAAFLIAHLIYSKIFSKSKSQYLNLFKTRLLIPAVLIIVWAISIFLLLKPNLGELVLPVLIYILVISLMSVAALSRYKFVSGISFKMVMMGAVLFMVSDMFIALNKFYSPMEHERLLVMSTYILSQYLIVEGLLSEEKFLTPET